MSIQAAAIDKLDSRTFDDLMEQQDPFGKNESRIDLSGIRLITPVALVSLAAMCYALGDVERYPVIFIDDPSVRSYLLRAGFIQVLDPVANFEPEFPPEMSHGYDSMRGSNPMLIEVTKIETGASLPELLDQIVWVLQHRLKYKKYDAFDAATAVSEICRKYFRPQ